MYICRLNTDHSPHDRRIYIMNPPQLGYYLNGKTLRAMVNGKDRCVIINMSTANMRFFREMNIPEVADWVKSIISRRCLSKELEDKAAVCCASACFRPSDVPGLEADRRVPAFQEGRGQPAARLTAYQCDRDFPGLRASHRMHPPRWRYFAPLELRLGPGAGHVCARRARSGNLWRKGRVAPVWIGQAAAARRRRANTIDTDSRTG
jgi:hypothetical protein